MTRTEFWEMHPTEFYWLVKAHTPDPDSLPVGKPGSMTVGTAKRIIADLADDKVRARWERSVRKPKAVT